MIPILYDKNETSFTHNGIGLLTETTKATVTEERNGSYELSLQYPITGRFYSEIADGAVIKVKANETSEPQLFRIYKSSKPLNGMVTYSAEHISYDLNGIPLLGFSIRNTTPQTAIMRAIEESALPCDFSVWSNIDTLNGTTLSAPCSIRALLGGQNGSILDVWGGEYEFDNFMIKLHAHRGTDNGVVIEYGKNLKDLKQESNISECYTHLMPYASYTLENESGGSSEPVYVYLKEKVIPLTKAENIGHNKAHIMDFSDRFGENEEITEEKLRTKATAYAESANLGTPKVNITVSFVQLWQTEEYKNIAPLERVRLCDTVTVRFSKLGVDANAKVIKTVYNSLEEKYDSITLGDAKSSFADTVNNQSSQIEAVRHSIAKASEDFKKAIENATNLITGQSGGYVVLNPPENPQEILILDKPTIEEAVNVWRWNKNGLGHSKTGYDGTYTMAATADGTIIADMIKAGTLQGIKIIADDGSIGGFSIADKCLEATAEGQEYPSVMQLMELEDVYTSGNPENPAYLYLDFNGNGRIESGDAFLLQRFLRGIETTPKIPTLPVKTKIKINPNNPNAIIEIQSIGGYSKGSKTIFKSSGINIPAMEAIAAYIRKYLHVDGKAHISGDLVIDGDIVLKGEIKKG